MKLDYVFRMLPRNVVAFINNGQADDLQEIRIRVNRNTILKYCNEEVITDFIPNENDMINILHRLCENSIYSFQSQICNGFVTLYGGHRVGITGHVVMNNEKISNINYISALNFRIAKEIIGSSNKILKYVIDNGKIQNTLIVSRPGNGKTTILRDLVRNLSNMGYTVSLIDERGEIAAMYNGVPQNDVGLRCDVLDNVTKSLGMKIAVRTMSPDIIVSDEIGTKEDIEAINYGVLSGVNGIFTAHGSSIMDIKLNENLNKIYEQKVFSRIIFLEKMGKIRDVYKLENNLYKLVDENFS